MSDWNEANEYIAGGGDGTVGLHLFYLFFRHVILRWFVIPTTNILPFVASDLREVRIPLLSRLWVRIMSHCEFDMNMGSMF